MHDDEGGSVIEHAFCDLHGQELDYAVLGNVYIYSRSGNASFARSWDSHTVVDVIRSREEETLHVLHRREISDTLIRRFSERCVN
jgi:hypothetical protein